MDSHEFLELSLDIMLSSFDSGISLLEAAKLGNAYVVHALLLAGVNPNSPLDEEEGLAAIHYATKYGDIEILHELLSCDGVDVNIRTEDGRTSMMLAVSYARHDALSRLLRHPSCDVNAVDTRWHMTALHRAADLGCEECVSALLQAGADPKVIDIHHTTPMLLAINSEFHNTTVVKLLLVWNCRDNDDFRLLDMALRRGHFKAAELLLRGGFNLPRRLYNELVSTGCPLQPLIVEMYRNPVPRTLQEQCRLRIQATIGTQYPSKIRRLGLPEALREYLLFPELA